MSAKMQPYTVSVPDSALKSLDDKLAGSCLPDDPFEPHDWDLGVPSSNIRRLVHQLAYQILMAQRRS